MEKEFSKIFHRILTLKYNLLRVYNCDMGQ